MRVTARSWTNKRHDNRIAALGGHRGGKWTGEGGGEGAESPPFLRATSPEGPIMKPISESLSLIIKLLTIFSSAPPALACSVRKRKTTIERRVD